jgi:hypothetical protein
VGAPPRNPSWAAAPVRNRTGSFVCRRPEPSLRPESPWRMISLTGSPRTAVAASRLARPKSNEPDPYTVKRTFLAAASCEWSSEDRMASRAESA